MEFQGEDRICFKYHSYLSDECAGKISDTITRARSRTNKEEARYLMSRADTLGYRVSYATVEGR